MLLSESNKHTNRPKIGLVLKGGGALGLAHVGVLKVIEEQRIPIDFVAGTSIGSIVGAAYSSGTTVAEMERILNETDWNALFGEKVQREYVDYRNKGGRERELFGEGKIGIKNGSFITPKGVVTGNNIRILFQKMFGYPPSPILFDSLPIPFRAITADVETGKAYIPDKGDLATVVRASMSIPGAFSPVEIDGKLLVDGGIVNNMPVDVAIKMGADILIVVDLLSTLANRDQLESPLAVTGQVVGLLLAQNSMLSRQLVRPQDVVVEPNVSGYGVSDFPKGVELMAIGEKAARQQIDKLKKLSISETEYQKYYQKRTTRIELPKTVDFVKVNNDSIYPTKHIKEKITIKPGEPFDPKKLDENVNNIYQTGQFESVEYSVATEGDKTGVQINADGKDWVEKYLRFGFSLEDNLDGDNQFRLGVAGRVNSITNKGSYLETVAEIGANPKISAELYQLLSDTSNYFVNPKVSFGQNIINVSKENDILAQYNRLEGVANIAFGRRISTIGETKVGVLRGFGELSREIGDPSLNEFSYDLGDAYWRFDLDNLDQVDFPTKGYRFSTSYTAAVDQLGASGGEFQDLSTGFVLPVSYGRSTFILTNRFTNTFGDRPIHRYNTLGGFFNISGSLQNSYPASDFNSTGLRYFRRFSEVDNPFFNIAAFAGISYEATTLHSEDDRLSDYSLIHSGALFVGADTPLFPVYLAYGSSDQGNSSFYVVLGRLNTNRN
jgi:NTE family protein